MPRRTDQQGRFARAPDPDSYPSSGSRMASDPRELRPLQNEISKGLLRRSFRISSVRTKTSKPLLVYPCAAA